MRTPMGERKMIVGAHSINYSKDADADRTFLKDVIRMLCYRVAANPAFTKPYINALNTS